jgi:hypothetical protein
VLPGIARRQVTNALYLTLLSLVLVVNVVSATSSQTAALMSAESADVRFSWVGTRANFTFVFDVLNKRNGDQSQIVVSNQTRVLQQMYVVNANRGYILGEFSSGIPIATVLDFSTRTAIDQFLLYRPSLSDDRRYLSFMRFFPPHGDPNVSSQYMVYDLTALPTQNRVSGNLNPQDLENVGIPYFPANGTNVPSNNGIVHEPASPSFFWLQDKHVVTIADRAQSAIRLVVLDLRGGIQNRRVFTAPIDGASLVGRGRTCRSFREPGSEFTVWNVVASNPNLFTFELRSGAEVCGEFRVAVGAFRF